LQTLLTFIKYNSCDNIHIELDKHLE